jgi:hypothetical protein
VRGFIPALAAILSGCAAGHVIESLPDPATQVDLAEPNYRQIIAENIATIFPTPSPLGMLEISGIWRTNHFKGPAWATCLKIHAENAPQEYAVFIQDGKIIDQRVGVAVDRCNQQSYQPFEPSNFIQQANSNPAQQKNSNLTQQKKAGH